MVKSKKEVPDEEIKREETKEDDDQECCLCMFEKNEVVLPCTHAFCETCIKDWLKRENGCPLCR